jgi:hypothetical protein
MTWALSAVLVGVAVLVESVVAATSVLVSLEQALMAPRDRTAVASSRRMVISPKI